MSHSTTSYLCQLPLEVLYRIFYHLDIPDILRIRRVSRSLNQVTYCRDIWSDAYRTAQIVRPPGPLPSQSARELENALVSSFRIDRTLRHRYSMAQWERPPLRSRKLSYSGLALVVRLVFRRFLLMAFRDRIRCYDLNHRKLRARVIYRSTGGILKAFECISAVDDEGRPFACVILNEDIQTTRRISIYFFNVGEKARVTLDLLYQFERSMFEIDTIDLGPRVIVIQGQVTDELDDDWDIVAFDVHTRTQLLLPPLAHATSDVPEMSEFEGTVLPMSISTSTHLLLTWSFYTMDVGWRTLFQAFALPRPDALRYLPSTSTPLSLSHSSVISDIYIQGVSLLHDSVVDPTTREILITIKAQVSESSRPVSTVSKHGILRLSDPPTSHEVGTISFRPDGLFNYPGTTFFQPSFNGTGRVFYTFNTGYSWTVDVLEYVLRPNEEDEGRQEAKFVEYASLLRFPTPRTLLDFDAYSGRICIQSEVINMYFQPDVESYGVIEIIDFVV